MSDPSHVLVVTTREYDYWASMQEVLPAFEGVWSRVAQIPSHQVEVLHADVTADAIAEVRTPLAHITHVVVTAATPATVRTTLSLRRDHGVTAPIVIYSHGDVTTGFEAFGDLTDTLTTADVLVVACEAEATIATNLFPTMTVRVVPWPLVDQYVTTGRDPLVSEPTSRLACVGRVSEQKNIHTLLFALWLLRRRGSTYEQVVLESHGGEDGHGSPNMGMPGMPYPAYLKDLAANLGLESVVEWHGFTARDHLFATVHSQPHVLVSASLHSDENFGSSVMATLANGRQVVATGWGGHHDFAPWFPRQLTLVPVRRSDRGPVVHPGELADAIAAALDVSGSLIDAEDLDRGLVRFSEAGVVDDTVQALTAYDGAPVPLEPSPALRQLEENRAAFGGGRRTFVDYADRAAAPFFAAYGMRDRLEPLGDGTYVLPPWVRVDDGAVRISDPHRGDLVIAFDGNGPHREVVHAPSLRSDSLPEESLRLLVAEGYAFALDVTPAAT